MNKIMLIGRLTKDPELRYTQSGSAVASFTLAVNRRFANQNGEREADFINCVAWQKTGEFVANYFKKGQLMALEGRLQVRSYDGNDGQRRWVTEVVAEEAYFADSKRDGEAGGSFDATFGTMPESAGSSDFEVSSGDDLPF